MSSSQCLFLTYREHRCGGMPINPKDAWPNYTDEIVQFNLEKCFLKEKSVNHWLRHQAEVDFKPKIGDNVYVLVVRYTTGGTFGRTVGAWYIVGVYKDETRADEIAQSIRDHTYEGYKPWRGYFEHLENADVFELKVE